MSGALLHAGNGRAFEFLNGLKDEERSALRKAVRRVHMRHFKKHLLTDYEADRIIEAIGPESAEKMLKAAVDSQIDRWGE